MPIYPRIWKENFSKPTSVFFFFLRMIKEKERQRDSFELQVLGEQRNNIMTTTASLEASLSFIITFMLSCEQQNYLFLSGHLCGEGQQDWC